MKRKAAWWLMTLVCAISSHGPAAADWLITREGTRIETRGAWKVKNQLVVFTLPNGTLSSLRLSEIDLAASEKATAEAKAPPAPSAPAPSATEPSKSRTVLTDDSVRQSRPPSGGPTTFSVLGHGSLKLAVPEGWTAEIQQPPKDLPPTFIFKSTAGPRLNLRVTALWSPGGDPGFNTPEAIKKQTADLGNRLLPTSVEKSLTLKELKAPSGLGYWFSLTDRAPKPGEFKYMSQGAVPAGDLLLVFTALTDTAPPDGFGEALALLASAEQVQSQGQAATGAATSVYAIGLPGAGWAVTLDLPGFKVLDERERPDGQGKMMQASNSGTSMNISVSVEREPGLGSAKKCRDFYWAKDLQAPIPKSEIAFSEYGPLAIVTWMVPEFRGARILQRNLKAFLSLRDICADVHLSKVNYQPSDQALFDAVIRTIRIKEQ